MASSDSALTCPQFAELGSWGTVCRLGLATRGEARLAADAYLMAIDRGIHHFNWCGYDDGLSAAVRQLGARRRQICLAAQLEARTASAAREELNRLLEQLGTDYIDVLTYYYVEEPGEWEEIIGSGGAAEVLEQAKSAGQLRMIGLTSHQRPLAAQIANSGRIDLLMIRYNAAHRGAEKQIFPTTQSLAMPVVAYTALRWQALLQPTLDDPDSFAVPSALECYQFVLQHPAVSVVVAAPNTAEELETDLSLLDDWRALSPARYAEIQAHGDRVRRHAGSFP